MAEYRLTATDVIIRANDGASIPNDPANRDHVEYTRWLALAGNAPDPYVKPPPTVDEVRDEALLADTDRQTIFNQIRNATPTQIKNYVNTQVTDLASARVMLRNLTLLVAMQVRQ